MKDERSPRSGQRPRGAAAWTTLRSAFWPEGTPDEAREIALLFEGRLEELDATGRTERPIRDCRYRR